MFNGFYDGMEIFFRQVRLQSTILDQITLQERDVNKTLFLGYAGYVIGYQKIISNVVCIDGYFGGGFFYSQYAGDKKPTHYQSNYQIDFTGFYLNSGISIGITY